MWWVILIGLNVVVFGIEWAVHRWRYRASNITRTRLRAIAQWRKLLERQRQEALGRYCRCGGMAAHRHPEWTDEIDAQLERLVVEEARVYSDYHNYVTRKKG